MSAVSMMMAYDAYDACDILCDDAYIAAEMSGTWADIAGQMMAESMIAEHTAYDGQT
jgi:hypothetical protein